MFTLNAKIVRREIFSRGMTLAEFAKATGVGETTIQRIVGGKNLRVSAKVIGAIARFCKIDGEELIIGTKEAA